MEQSIYSPAFNPAEYLIHRVRQDALYHLPSTFTFTLQDKAGRVQEHLAQGPAADTQTNGKPPASYRQSTQKRENREKLAKSWSDRGVIFGKFTCRSSSNHSL